MTHFVQWRCNIFVKQSQTNYSYLAHSDKNCSWAGHSCPSKQLGYTFIPVNLPQSIKCMFVAKMIKQHWIKHIVSRTNRDSLLHVSQRYLSNNSFLQSYSVWHSSNSHIMITIETKACVDILLAPLIWRQLDIILHSIKNINNMNTVESFKFVGPIFMDYWNFIHVGSWGHNFMYFLITTKGNMT